MKKTYSPKIAEIERRWHVVDADGLCLGRLASQVAHVLRGKHKPTYAPHMDTGDFVIVVNAEKVVLSGRKEDQKVYYRHSGRPGSLRQETARQRRQRLPAKLVEAAVWGMLPKNSLGRRLFRKLKVYAGPDHPHQSQQPAPLEVPQARMDRSRITS
ncbi:MAG TPA: 50S ribosomal protein L13 [Thermoanaerobaculia bacterium]|jgi:large subunit ribosomal protein L13